MAAAAFEAQIKAVNAFAGPMRAMLAGMKDILQAARNVSQGSRLAATDARAAGAAAAGAIRAEAAAAEAAHLRYIRATSAQFQTLHAHVKEVGGALNGVTGPFAKFLPALGALGAGGSIAGLLMLTKGAADATIEFTALTKITGVSGRDLAGLNLVAKSAGVGSETMAGGIEKFNKAMGLAATGKNKTLGAIMDHLHIAMRDGNKHVRSFTDMLPQLADAMKNTEDPALRAFLATQLFGKAGQDLIPVLQLGGEEIARLAEEGRKFSYIATPAQRENLIKFGHTWEEMEIAAGGFRKELAANLAPVLEPIVASARNWLVANREWIALAITEKVKLFVEALRKIDFEKLIQSAGEWLKSAHEFIDSFYGAGTVIGAFTLAIGSPLIVAIMGVISFVTLLGRALKVASVAAWANPILLIAGALALAAYEVWQHWDEVRVAFQDIGDGAVKSFERMWQGVKQIIDNIKGAVEWFRTSALGRSLNLSVESGAPAALPPPPSLLQRQSPAWMPTYDEPPGGWAYRPGASAAPAASAAPVAAPAEVRVKVDFTNTPPGTAVQTDSSGGVGPIDTNVGFANPLAYGY